MISQTIRIYTKDEVPDKRRCELIVWRKPRSLWYYPHKETPYSLGAKAVVYDHAGKRFMDGYMQVEVDFWMYASDLVTDL